jgi:hypothetical protein
LSGVLRPLISYFTEEVVSPLINHEAYQRSRQPGELRAMSLHPFDAGSRDLGLSYKNAFVLLHKLSEAMAEKMSGRVVGGDGKWLRSMAAISVDT